MRRFRRLTIALVLAFVVSMMLPDNWYDQFHFGGVPLGAVMLACVSLALVAHMLMSPALMTPALYTGLLFLALTVISGYVRGNIGLYSLKFFTADVFCFVALLAGYAVGCTRRREDASRLARDIATTSGCVVVITYVALFFGFVSTKFDIQGRTVTASIFNAVGMLMILLPWAAVSGTDSARSGWRTGLLFGITVWTGLISATRTILIGVAFFGLLYVILRRRHLGASFILRVCAALVLVLLLVSSGLSNVGAFAFQRLNETEINEESRWEELTLWWPQVKDDIVLGQGMGSRFVSNVVVDGDPLASTPHVGIMSFLMKGGVVVFFSCVVLPLLMALRILLSPTRPDDQRGAAATVLMFIALSCLSGGWFPLSLFAYGMAIASMTSEQRSRGIPGPYYKIIPQQTTLEQPLLTLLASDEDFARH